MFSLYLIGAFSYIFHAALKATILFFVCLLGSMFSRNVCTGKLSGENSTTKQIWCKNLPCNPNFAKPKTSCESIMLLWTSFQAISTAWKICMCRAHSENVIKNSTVTQLSHENATTCISFRKKTTKKRSHDLIVLKKQEGRWP